MVLKKGDNSKSASLPFGISPRVASAALYALQLFPIAGLAVAIVAYAAIRNEFVRHNAVQAFFFSVFFTVLAVILVRASLSLAVPLLSVAVAVAFLWAALKSYRGEKVELPLVNFIAG